MPCYLIDLVEMLIILKKSYVVNIKKKTAVFHSNKTFLELYDVKFFTGKLSEHFKPFFFFQIQHLNIHPCLKHLIIVVGPGYDGKDK